MKSTPLIIICVPLVVVSCVGCELIGAPKGIACANLRQLSIGMRQSEVTAILGPPPRQYPSEPYRGEPPTDPITWDYSNRSAVDGGVRLFVRFVHGRLTEVDSYIRTFLRDLKDAGPRHTVFSLEGADIRIEGAEFKRVYCPSSQ